MNKILVEKKHWNDIYAKNFNFINLISNSVFFRSYYHFALFSLLRRFIEQNGVKNVIEIGCAPGNYLVKFRNFFNLTVYGIEYSGKGYHRTIENMKKYNIPTENIWMNDFLNNEFLENNKGKYDSVFSTGFIEHFDSPEDIARRQAELLHDGGLMICIVPNKRYLNALLTSKRSLAMHNRKIMDLAEFRSIFEKSNLKILYCRYFGGIFNAGLFHTKNPLIKVIFMLFFVFQRIFLDNLQKIYFKFSGKDCTSKYSSPSLLCIAKKSA